MFIEPWMVLAIVAAFGACAYYSHRNGKREGLLIGIDGAFSYLEKHGCIQFTADGSIKGGKGKAQVMPKK